MRICPKCGAYYADAHLAFCLADGTPLVKVEPGSEKWNQGNRVLEEKATRLNQQRRRVRWRRIMLGASATLVLAMLFVTSFTVETTAPKPPPPPPPPSTPTHLVTLSPSPTTSPSPSSSTSPSPSPSPSPSVTAGYKISGRVTANQSLGPVTIRLEGAKTASTTTDGEGHYIFSDLRAGGNYIVSPRGQMKFKPLSRALNKLRRDETADFVVETEVFKISGRVVSASRPASRVKIALEGSKLTSTTTDTNGYYTFSNLRSGGSYTVTPSGQRGFKPSSRSFDNLRRDETADFVAPAVDDSEPTDACTAADQEREQNNLVNRNRAAWERSFESEKPAVIARVIAENRPVGVEPTQIEATASLGPLTYTVVFLKVCKPNLVRVSYEWRVIVHARGETKTVKVPKRKTCGKAVGLWLCYPA